MVLVLAPLHRKYNIKRVIVSTYQSITGTGVKAVQQLENEYAGVQGKWPISIYSQRDYNAILSRTTDILKKR
jgi:aspartate-semialdehyde dehydrogenase